MVKTGKPRNTVAGIEQRKGIGLGRERAIIL
jgi:hypothetical protein